MTTTNPTEKNPFDLPELSYWLSRFVAFKDALSCALVCKAWTADFLSAVWFQVDFDDHPQFAKLSPDIVAKHGHLIRIVKNAKTPAQVSVLNNAGVDSLRDLHIDPTASAIQHVQVYEIIYRNSFNLQHLHLFAATLSHNKEVYSTHYVSAPALLPSSGPTPLVSSKLKALSLKQLCLTHNSLVTILQGCPGLTELRLPYTDMVGTPTRSFQHTGVKVLGSTFKSLFHLPTTGPSLLSYFPQLTTLSTFNYGLGAVTVPSTVIKGEISRYCPQLTGYYLEDSVGTITREFLTKIASSVTEIGFLYNHISLDIIMAILLHQTTMKAVKHFDVQPGFDFAEKEDVIPVSDDFQESGRFLQLIPRCCSKLEEINLHGHEMDMDDVEMDEWVCKDLKILRLRVKGLDTKDKILKAIALWRAGYWRKRQEKAGAPEAFDEQASLDQSIEARVARHLVKFDKLWIVWLGIDFKIHPQFDYLSPDTIAKHGHLIKIVKNASAFTHAASLDHPCVNNLRALHIRTETSVVQHLFAHDIISRNSTFLQDLDLFAAVFAVDKQDSFAHYVSSPGLVLSPSTSLSGPLKLKTLRVENLCMTHDGLIAILESCPGLREVRLVNTDVIDLPTKSSQHKGVTFFAASLKSLFRSNTDTAPSLLSYFPNLRTLNVWNFDIRYTIPSAEMKDNIARYCPRLTGYQLEDITGAIAMEFLTNIARNIGQLVFRHNNMSIPMIGAILMHQESLKTIMHFNIQPDLDFEEDRVAPLSTHFRRYGNILQQIPRACSSLKIMDLHFLEMDMDDVERGRWVCKDLTTLRIRIKGLDTEEKIVRTIGLWRAGCRRRWQEKAMGFPEPETKEDKTDNSIEARVAHHLLKFDKLLSVWLGYKTWTTVYHQ
ncbi:hypothetical protein BGW39_007704 [Mortierella sp. 14UC]|nr:hypothetical protein BGW39_007704 [Mortierella sp. 14UC]